MICALRLFYIHNGGLIVVNMDARLVDEEEVAALLDGYPIIKYGRFFYPQV